MSLTAILLTLATVTTDDDLVVRATSWRIDSAYVVRLYAKGSIIDATQEFKTPSLEKIVSGKLKLNQRRGNLDLPEKHKPGDELRVSTQVAFPKKGEIKKFDRIEGTLRLLAGGDLHQTDLDGKGFRSKRKKKLSIPAMKDAGAGLSVWTSRMEATVFRVQGRVDLVKRLSIEGPHVRSFALYEADPYLALLPKGKMPKGLTLVVHRTDGTKVKIPKWKAGKAPKILEHETLRNAGIEVTVGPEPRDVLHLISSGDASCFHTLDLFVGDQVLEHENVKTAPTLTDSEDQWIYPSIPADAVLRIVVREGAEWQDVPFAVTDVAVEDR